MPIAPPPRSRVLPDDTQHGLGDGRASRTTDEIRPRVLQRGVRVIMAIGPAGSGKGGFVEVASGKHHPHVRRIQLPGTRRDVREISFTDAKGCQTLLVNLPRFRQAPNHGDVLRIADWVKERYQSHGVLSGLLVFHRTSTQATASMLHQLAVFRKACGTTFANTIIVSTNRGDKEARNEHCRQIKHLLRADSGTEGKTRVQSFHRPYDTSAQSILRYFEVVKPQSTENHGLDPYCDQPVRKAMAVIRRSLSCISDFFGNSKRKRSTGEVEESIPLLPTSASSESRANTRTSTSINPYPSDRPLDANSDPVDPLTSLPSPETHRHRGLPPVRAASKPTPAFRTTISLILRVLKSQCRDKDMAAMLDDDWAKKLHDSAVFPSPESRADATKFRSICDAILLDLNRPRSRICRRCRRRVPKSSHPVLHDSPSPTPGPSTKPDQTRPKRRRRESELSRFRLFVQDFVIQMDKLLDEADRPGPVTIVCNPTFIHSLGPHTILDISPRVLRVDSLGRGQFVDEPVPFIEPSIPTARR